MNKMIIETPDAIAIDGCAQLNKAVSAVMAGIHSLRKSEVNKHGQYNYVSVDAFKDLVRPLMAQHGLSLSITEIDYGIETLQGRNGATVNAKITYELRLRHISGEIGDPERATIMLPHTGAQTAGAAKSYVIKEYLKGKFLVSTGDKDMIEGGADADAFAPQEYVGSPQPKPTPIESVADGFIRKFNQADTAEAFEAEVTKARAAWKRIDTDGRDKLVSAIEARRAYWAMSNIPMPEAAE